MANLLPDPEDCNKRELKRDTKILRELDDSDDPSLLVLYHHLRDQAFDCMNAAEYTEQMLRYYKNNLRVTLVAPRRIREHDYFLVGLQNQEVEKNVLCELSFLAFRQFIGISMLIKKRCFECHKAAALMCTACHCACFCSRDCQRGGWRSHKDLCKLVKKSGSVVVETDCVQIEL